MSPVVDYLTLEEYLESQRSLRSPTLQRSVPNFDSLSTPPPLVDAPDDDELSDSEPVGGQEHPSTLLRSNGRPQPSLYDGLLIKELAPYYPTDIAERAGTELPVDSPDIPCEDRFEADAGDNHLLMIAGGSQRKVLTPPNPQALSEGLIASRRASEKLNIALSGHSTVTTCEAYGHGCPDSGCVDNMYSTHDHRSKKEAKVSITNLTNDEADDTLLVGQLTIQTSPQRPGLDVVPPTRPVLPSLHITPSNTTHFRQRHDSITASPTLGRYTITPSDGHPQTLARIQNHVPASATSSQSADFRQTLPSLVTALSSATDSNGTPYLDASPGMSRPSPSHASPYGLSPAGYAQSTPTVAMSPPRFSSNPTAWRTLSNNSSNSGTSEYASGQGSGNSSTPATRPSPSHSVSTLHSQYQASEHDSNPDSDYSTPINANLTNPNTQSSSSAQQGYQCTFQGCTAPPFQTQYLLNSHTNVHSNQRPHFCPVEGCPRGPGGQGFKRKNEMIRHGLVHQSPGYVCPFCPDQQHKYPRPDNLQRHVRVHHVDRDKDDPLLRDVLAQRPEGGSRGRRRRMV